MDKPIVKNSNLSDEANVLARLYAHTSKDKLRVLLDEELISWVQSNIGRIEYLLLFIQRETARKSVTAEAETNLNNLSLAQSQILNRIWEIAEEGAKKNNK